MQPMLKIFGKKKIIKIDCQGPRSPGAAVRSLR